MEELFVIENFSITTLSIKNKRTNVLVCESI